MHGLPNRRSLEPQIYTLKLHVLPLTSPLSGQDGTVRVWGLPNRSHQFLQQTCVFSKGSEGGHDDMEGQVLGHLVWNASGKMMAGAMDNLVNVWTVAGTRRDQFLSYPS